MHTKNKKRREGVKTYTLGEIVPKNKLNILTTQDKDRILKYLRDIVIDLNNMELVFATVNFSPDQLNRTKQFSANTKKRIRNVIWTISAEEIVNDPTIKNN